MHNDLFRVEQIVTKKKKKKKEKETANPRNCDSKWNQIHIVVPIKWNKLVIIEGFS